MQDPTSTPPLKRCASCGEYKQLDNFYPIPTSRDGLRGVCKPCHRAGIRDRLNKMGPAGRLVETAKARAKARGVPFGLTAADVDVPFRCPVLGIKLVPGQGRNGPIDSSPTLDRIIPALGYVRGNVIVVSWRANRIKNDATIEELRSIADFYASLATL